MTDKHRNKGKNRAFKAFKSPKISKRAEKVSSHLAKTAVNALGHINIVSGGSSAAIGSLFCFNGNRLSWANGFTQFTSDASFFSTWIPSQCMFTSESWAQWSLFKWIIDRGWFFEEMAQCNTSTSNQFSHENCGTRTFGQCFIAHVGLNIVYVDETVIGTPWIGQFLIIAGFRQTGFSSICPGCNTKLWLDEV